MYFSKRVSWCLALLAASSLSAADNKSEPKDDKAAGKGLRIEVTPQKFDVMKFGVNNVINMSVKVFPADGSQPPQSNNPYFLYAKIDGKQPTATLRVFQDGNPAGKVLEEIPLLGDGC